MNKYQKALENFGKHRFHINEQIHDLRTQIDELDTDAFNFYGLNDLQELVEKETPMKPINQYKIDFGIGNCGDCLKCERVVNYQMAYCPDCGQRIDWRKRDE